MQQTTQKESQKLKKNYFINKKKNTKERGIHKTRISKKSSA